MVLQFSEYFQSLDLICFCIEGGGWTLVVSTSGYKAHLKDNAMCVNQTVCVPYQGSVSAGNLSTHKRSDEDIRAIVAADGKIQNQLE